MAVEMDGTFLVVLVQCFVGFTSVLAQQAAQLIMVSGSYRQIKLVTVRSSPVNDKVIH